MERQARLELVINSLEGYGPTIGRLSQTMVADTGLEPVTSPLSGERSKSNGELIRQTGAGNRHRTDDLSRTDGVFCQMNYSSTTKMVRRERVELPT